jgi:hypothetical protein
MSLTSTSAPLLSRLGRRGKQFQIQNLDFLQGLPGNALQITMHPGGGLDDAPDLALALRR